MEATKQFINDALTGGYGNWEKPRLSAGYVKYEQSEVGGWITKSKTPVAEILLDPLAWQAVGKTRKWSDQYHTTFENTDCRKDIDSGMDYIDKYQLKMYRFIDNLWDGNSIEESLSLIT